jgi:hypothetical protein
VSFAKSGRSVSDSPGANYAPTKFASDKPTQELLKLAMFRLFDKGTIKIEPRLQSPVIGSAFAKLNGSSTLRFRTLDDVDPSFHETFSVHLTKRGESVFRV